MNEQDIIALINLEIQDALGYDSDVLAENRASALDYYNGNMKQSPKGRSDIVSHDVADTVNALMSQIGEIFRASSVEFEAENEQDEQASKLESDFVQRLMEKNDEYETFDKSVFDALLQGNGWIEVGRDITKEISEERYQDITTGEAAYMIEDAEKEGDVEVIGKEDNFTIKITKTTQKLTIDSIPPELMLFSSSSENMNLDKVRFVAKRHYMTVSELIEAGLSEMEAQAIPNVSDEYWIAGVARQADLDDTQDELNGNQDATALKETYICYFLIDMDGNNAVQRRKIHIGGSSIIMNEPCSFVPFVTGSPLPMPHRIQGQGVYDIMKQVQDSKTGILRAYMDNLSVMNKSRVGYLKGEVDLEPLLDGRINGAIGMNRPDALIPLPSNDIGAVAIQGLSYLDSVRTSRGGAALDLNNSEMQIASSSALGASREYESKEKMAGLYCKNLAHSLLKGVFIMVHKTLRIYISEDMDAKIRGQWHQTNPSDWQPRECANLIAGLTQSEKTSKLMGLEKLMAEQKELIQAGKSGILTDDSKYYNAAGEWITTSSISSNPEEYLIDPNSQEAQQVQQSNAQAQEEQQAAQAEQQQMILDLQKDLEQMKDDTNRYVQDMKTRFDYYKADLEAEIKEAELVVDGISRTEKPEQPMELKTA